MEMKCVAARSQGVSVKVSIEENTEQNGFNEFLIYEVVNGVL